MPREDVSQSYQRDWLAFVTLRKKRLTRELVLVMRAAMAISCGVI